ncbi:GumC family protein [Geminicoccus roseus]|uniref:GumC family protein n=1 Tax=Geminicoccus roseus TaxID=404900 RepID=UPI00041AA00E|nr:polysaccharide biosynthesis tyrosine autokinase [Geminicoccus roseus]
MAPTDLRAASIRKTGPAAFAKPFYAGAFDEFPGPKEILRVLKRHKLLMIGVVLPITLLASGYGALAPKRYDAHAMMALDPKEAPLRNFGVLPGQLGRDMPALETQLQVVLSPIVLADVIERLDLAENPAFMSPPSVRSRITQLFQSEFEFLENLLADLRERLVPVPMDSVEADEATGSELIARLADNLNVEQVGQSFAITLSYRATDPVLAASVVNETARSYIRHQISSKLGTSEGAAEYLEARLEQLRTEVESADSELESYRAKNSLPVDGTQEALSRRASDLNLELIEVRSEIAVTEARMRTLQAQQASSDPSVLARALDSQTAETLSLEAASLARRRAELLLTYGEGHPSVQALRADEAALRRTIRQEAERSLAEVQRSLDLLKVKAQEIEREIEATEARIGQDQSAMVQIANLKRDAQVNRQLYEEMLTQRKLLAEQQSMVQPDVEIIAEASADIEPSSPPFLFFPLVGLVGSSALGMLLALIRDRADPRVRSARQVERQTGQRVMARLPKERKFRKLRPEQLVDANPNGVYAESLRHLYHDLEAVRSDPGSLVVLVTSTAPGEGKSSTVSGLAGLLRRSGKRVAVIDLDLRRPRLFRLFAKDHQLLPVNELLTASVEEWEQEMAAMLTRPFTVLPARAAGDEVLALLESRQLSATIKALRLRYDYILLDTPPVLPTSDAPFLARYADATVMVCRWLVTEVSAVREASERLAAQFPGPLAGLVVNMIDRAAYEVYAPSYGELAPRDGTYPYGSRR